MPVRFNVLYKENYNFFISSKSARKIKIFFQANFILLSMSIRRSAVLSNGNTYDIICILLKFQLTKITLKSARVFFFQNYQVIGGEVSLLFILHWTRQAQCRETECTLLLCLFIRTTVMWQYVRQKAVAVGKRRFPYSTQNLVIGPDKRTI